MKRLLSYVALATLGMFVTIDYLRPFSVFKCCLKQWTMEKLKVLEHLN